MLVVSCRGYELIILNTNAPCPMPNAQSPNEIPTVSQRETVGFF
ncbi:MAG: hypothetical protein AAF630_05025 [Cyanobacteria bacterium P01_C01_bin.38]